MEETSLLLLQKLKESFIKFSQIFSYDIPDDSFFKYLKTQEKESNQIRMLIYTNLTILVKGRKTTLLKNTNFV